METTEKAPQWAIDLKESQERLSQQIDGIQGYQQTHSKDTKTREAKDKTESQDKEIISQIVKDLML